MFKSQKPVYVLGTGLAHDGSACLLKDGRIHVAIEKERVTRRKHDGGNDTEAISYCLEAAGITYNDLTLVVQNANFGMLRGGNEWLMGPRLLSESVPVVTISHHLAHAYSAIGTSPFDEAAVMVIDGCGNSFDDCLDLAGAALGETPPSPEWRHLYFEKDSYYAFKDDKVTPVFKDFSPWGMRLKNYTMHPSTTTHSIGGMYLAASMYVFNGFEDPGKLMGLAPYGRAGVHDFEIFELKDGRAFVRYDWMERFDRPCRHPNQFKRNFQYYADLAYRVQKELERAILYVINARYEMAPSKRLAYAGGVALNAVANRRILKETKFEEIYIQPAAGDNGLAVGCAYYGWMEVLKRERVRHGGSMALGRQYRNGGVSKALDAHKESVSFNAPADYVRQTAALLAEGKTVGWFQDGAEFGPRALGHRSILADPRRVEMRDFINSKIKFREDFRPFAPSVIAEDASVYFDCDYESPYMILIAPVRPEWRKAIPSVTHQDQSARIQTVTASLSPKYYELLRAFKERTGISVLLNTSFNRKGMPIVETPQEALDFFLNCALDVLVLDNYIVRKLPPRSPEGANPTEHFLADMRGVLERNAEAVRRIGGVFQINVTGVRTLIIDLSKEKPAMFEGAPVSNPSAVINITEKDLQTLRADPENEGAKLFYAGKIKVEGNTGKAMGLTQIFKLK
jgi:carbamoyltransferase